MGSRAGENVATAGVGADDEGPPQVEFEDIDDAPSPVDDDADDEFERMGKPSQVTPGRALSSSPALAAATLAVLVVPALVLGVRAMLKRHNRPGRRLMSFARYLMVDVDEEVVRAARSAPAVAQMPIRLVLSGDLIGAAWMNDKSYKIAGISKESPRSVQEIKRQVSAVKRQLFRRSNAWCGLSSPIPVIALELGVADCACFVDQGGEYSPWSSIVARGLFGYRCSAGQSSTQLVFAAPEGSTLLRCGSSLTDSSGRRNPQDDSLQRYLVAEDVFSVCGEAMSGVTPSVIEGVKRWAGSDQAQSLSLCQWLYHRVSGVRRFIRAPTDGDAPGKPSTGDILDALVRIRNVLHVGSDALAVNKTANSSGSAAGIRTGAALSAAEDYVHAKLVAEELSEACFSAMDEGLVFVVPTSPGAPPKMDADESEIAAWEVAVTRLNSLPALAGIPQVSIPIKIRPSVATVASASSPASFVGISLITRQRKDLVVLRSLEKLHGFIENDVATRAGRSRDNGEEKFDVNGEKELGNACFKNKEYARAAHHYTRCIAYDGTNPVYPSNRAMAYLKMGAYEDAEQDCNLALGIDPCNVKALLRRGAARAALGSFQEAAGDYSRVLDIEPGNRQAKEELVKLRKVL